MTSVSSAGAALVLERAEVGGRRLRCSWRVGAAVAAGDAGRGVVGEDWTTAALVEAAVAGDSAAWDELVDRYAALVHAVCRRMRLSDADALDVSQTVWLRLVEHLPRLREPAALPGWLVSTARHEALRVLRAAARPVPLDQWVELPATTDPVDADLLAAERRSALREAFASLPPASRELLALLLTDPPLAYEQISARLGIPVGSIGPTRARILDKLRRAPALAALLRDGDAEAPGPVPESRVRPGRTRASEPSS